MSSKKTPLWLVLENADEEGDPLVIMFKSGVCVTAAVCVTEVIHAAILRPVGGTAFGAVKPAICRAKWVSQTQHQ